MTEGSLWADTEIQPAETNTKMEKRLTKGAEMMEQVKELADGGEVNSMEMQIHIKIEKKIMKMLNHELGDTRDMFGKMESEMASISDLTRRVNDCENVLFKTNIDGRKRLFEDMEAKIDLIDKQRVVDHDHFHENIARMDDELKA
jgi:uncharacterized protein YwgA